MRILYAATRYEYGNPELGRSFEEMNFRTALEGMGHELVPFDFLARQREVGRREMNEELLRCATEDDFDLVFFFLHEDQIATRTIARIGECGTPTLNWFADDHWRFDGFSRRFGKALTWSVTTDPDTVPKYHAAGIENVILSQWACNRFTYDKTADALTYDVTFVG